MPFRVEKEIGGRIFSMETGDLARQADGAVVVRFGDSVVLVTVVANREPQEEIDFLPLGVEYREKAYAAGKIPGGFYKREGRPGDKATLIARLTDRPLRPLFPKNFFCETQIIASVMSVDQVNDPDILAMNGASAALTISDIPFDGPVGAVRIGLIDGKYIVNPTYLELEESTLDLVVAGTKEAIVMVEGGTQTLSEEILLDAIYFGQEALQPMIDMQLKLKETAGVEKRTLTPLLINEELQMRIKVLSLDRLHECLMITEKTEQARTKENLLTDICNQLSQEGFEDTIEICRIFGEIEQQEVRHKIIEEDIRPDGRKWAEIRPIQCQVSFLPRTHGSALFTRGQTQSLAVVTLGTVSDEQRIDDLQGESTKSFMLHYNFPPFCVGEVKPIKGPGRREVGHGMLAERALLPVIPKNDNFPYTVRIVSDILESNGSSSMATVCSGSLSLMDAAVPISSAVAGIAMGLVMEQEKVAILSDIQGIEDHYGDMDLKVAGTEEGITAFQMDVKIPGISREIIKKALDQARIGRLQILEIMNQSIDKPRADISPYAPRIITIHINVDRIRDVIGPGGKVIRGLIEQTGAKIDIDDDGTVVIASIDEEAAKKTVELILALTEEPEIGKIYTGKVKSITDFGAFIEVLPGLDGLLHVSEISHSHVKNVSDVLKIGDLVEVKLTEIDHLNRIKLSRKVLLPEPTEEEKRAFSRERSQRDQYSKPRDRQNRYNKGDNHDRSSRDRHRR